MPGPVSRAADAGRNPFPAPPLHLPLRRILHLHSGAGELNRPRRRQIQASRGAMVSGRGSSGLGGGQVGRGGSASGRGGNGEKSEAAKKRSDAARLHGSYRYTKYGLPPPPAFYRRESSFSRRSASLSICSASSASSASTSRAPPQPVKMEVDDAPEPRFAPGDYVEDAELDKILPTLEDAAGFAPGDFVDDHHLPTVLGLVSETSRREAEKAEEWRVVAEEQGKVYCDLISDDE